MRFVAAAAAVLVLALIVIIVSLRSNQEMKGGGVPGPSAPAHAAVRRPSVVDYRHLDERLRLLAAEPEIAGLAVAVVEDGEIRFARGYGETMEGSGDLVTADTVFRWASVSKGVAGALIAKLAGENRLSLYEPVGKYAYSLRLPAGNEHRATVSDLLSHRLGLFGHAQDSKLEDGMEPHYLRMTLASLNAICPPGSCHAYQNVAYDAASDVVEKVTGKSYRETVQEQLFGPLRMRSASLTRQGLFSAPSWARPHVGTPPRPVEVTESYYRVPAAGGVNSSITDLARWMRAQMGLAPQVLSPEVLENVQSPRSSTPGEMGRMRKFRERLSKATYGLGWRIYDYAGRKVVGHRGGVRGYRSSILFDPEMRSGVVVLWNSSTGKPSGIEFEVLDMLYKLERRDWLGLDAAGGGAETLGKAAPATG